MTKERWKTFSFFEQMANVGSEVERAIGWQEKNNPQYSCLAVDRALELLDLTIDDLRNKKRRRELGRLREVLVDYFYASNAFASSSRSWRNYFLAFAWAARLNVNG